MVKRKDFTLTSKNLGGGGHVPPCPTVLPPMLSLFLAPPMYEKELAQETCTYLQVCSLMYKYEYLSNTARLSWYRPYWAYSHNWQHSLNTLCAMVLFRYVEFLLRVMLCVWPQPAAFATRATYVSIYSDHAVVRSIGNWARPHDNW